MSQELAQYLEKALREGQLDSRGSFTLDLDRAKQLLGGALFEDPANYLLKIIQAAYLTEPEEIHLNIVGDTLQVDWCPGHLDLELEQVEKSILDFEIPPSPLMARPLLLGLRGAAQKADRVVWAQRDINRAQALVLAGQSGSANLARLDLPGQASLRPEYIFQIQRSTPRNSWLHRALSLNKFSDEVRRLESCKFSPLPIYLNHRLINVPRIPRMSESRMVGLGSFYDVLVERLILSREPLPQLLAAPPPAARPAFSYDLGHGVQTLGLSQDIALYEWRSFCSQVTGSTLFPHQSRPTSRAVSGGLSLNLLKNPGEIPLTVPGAQHVQDFQGWTRPNFRIPRGPLPALEPLAGHAYLVAPCQPAGEPSRVYVVQNGVLLNPIFMDLALPGMLVMVADAALKTDLSGLQPAADERLTELQKWLVEETQNMRRNARRTLRFGEKLSMNPTQLRELRQRHDVEEPDY